MKRASASWSSSAAPVPARACAARDGGGERRRQDEPAEPHRRGERLAGRARVDDALGRQPLQGADRVAVVAVLRVVVVLDEDRVAIARPVQQRRAPRRREHGAGGELVRGRQDHGVDVERAEPLDLQAVGVDRDRHRFEARVERRLGLRRPARVLDGDAPRAAFAQRPPDHARAPAACRPSRARGRRRRPRRAPGPGRRRAPRAARARRATRRSRAGCRAPRAARARRPPARRAAGRRRGRARRWRSRSAAAAARRSPPTRRSRPARRSPSAAVPAREAIAAEPAVPAGAAIAPARWPPGPTAGRDRRAGGDHRRGPLPRAEVPLGDQLGVGLHHDAARHAELRRERAARRQRAPGRQPAGAHAAADLVLEPAAERAARRRRRSTRSSTGPSFPLPHWSFHKDQCGP